jgi:hypothetical protein
MLRRLIAAVLAALLITQPAGAQLLRRGGGANGGSSAPILLSINGPLTGAADSNAKTLIDAGGWNANYLGTIPADINTVPRCFNASRAGFAFNGVSDFAATTYTDSICADHTIRLAAPNWASNDTSKVALSRTMYGDDVVSGVTNNSTLYSPAPLCIWTTPDRRFLASGTTTVSMSFACFHRDARSGQQIVGATCSIADQHSHTNTGYVTAPGTGSMTGDVFTVEDYTCTVSLTGMTAGDRLTYNVKAYPWLGSVAHSSVADSSLNTSAQSPGGSVERQFSPRYFVLDDGTRPGPAVAVWCPAGGTYTTGYCNGAPGTETAAQYDTTTPNPAHAFTTFVKIMDTLTDATKGKPFTKMAGCVNGCADGVTVYVGCVGVVAPFTGQATTVRPQLVGAIRFVRDPACSQANSNVQITAAVRPKLGSGSLIPSGEGALWFDDLVYSRGGNFQIGNAADSKLAFQITNAVVENTSSANSSSLVVNGGQSFYGTTINNVGSSTLWDNCSTNTETRLMRGVTATLAATANITFWGVLGSKFNGSAAVFNTFLANSSCAQSGSIMYSNYTAWPSTSTDLLTVADNNLDVNGLALVQNIFELNHTTNIPMIGLSRDCDATSKFTGTITNAILHYNIFLSGGENGSNSPGRQNIGYNSCSNPPRVSDTPAFAWRTHNLWDVRGNVFGLWFIKNDWFVYNSSCAGNAPCQTASANMIGGWPLTFGTDLQGNMQLFTSITAGGYGSDRMVTTLGLGSKAGTNANTLVFDPKWVSPQYTTWTGAAFTAPASPGSGNYRLGASSDCAGIVTTAMLKWGLYGNARPSANDACGVNPQ